MALALDLLSSRYRWLSWSLPSRRVREGTDDDADDGEVLVCRTTALSSSALRARALPLRVVVLLACTYSRIAGEEWSQLLADPQHVKAVLAVIFITGASG